MAQIPEKLHQIMEDFELSEGREKLELLIEYAESLPPIPDWLASQHAGMDQVQECMTPVFVQAQFDSGKMFYYFDIPKESPTVRGYAALLKEGVDGSTPEAVLAIPADFYKQMGLDQVLTQQRINGLSAVLAHMKRLAAEHLS